MFGSSGSFGVNGVLPSGPTGVIPGTCGITGRSGPGLLGSFGSFGYGSFGCSLNPSGTCGTYEPSFLYVTFSSISLSSAVTVFAATLTLSAKNPVTTGVSSFANSLLAGVHALKVSLPVTRLRSPVRVNFAS